MCAQLPALQMCGSLAPMNRDEQANRNQPQAVQWVPTAMYTANFSSLEGQWIWRKLGTIYMYSYVDSDRIQEDNCWLTLLFQLTLKPGSPSS